MLTCGMIFFSIASWNNGGGGRSTARNRKGDVDVLISNEGSTLVSDISDRMQIIVTSIDVEPGFLAPTEV